MRRLLLPAVIITIVLASGCTQQSQEPAPTTTSEEFCKAPYIRLGKGCCLDKDGNSICDQDEKPKETTSVQTTVPTTTTEETTTTLQETTTIAETIECRQSSDCGQSIEQRVCHNGDVFRQRVTYLCRKAGTPESQCIQKNSWVGGSLVSEPSPVDDCFEGCKDGKCI